MDNDFPIETPATFRREKSDEATADSAGASPDDGEQEEDPELAFVLS
jgi:hypothetical protein